MKILHKLILPLFFIMGIFCLASCSNDEMSETTNETEKTTSQNVKVTNGYLDFNNQNAFNSYVNKLRENENSSSNTNTRALAEQSNLMKIKGFTSIADTKKKVNISTRGSNDDADEEMTTDEFNIMKAENILVDPLLTQVMDTTLRIQIGEQLYKVTKYGTFYANVKDADFLQSAVDKFDTTLVDKCTPGRTISLEHGVTFVSLNNNKTDASEVELIPQNASTRALDSETNLNLQNGYNTEDYKWKNHSLWQKFWDTTTGKDVDRERTFDSKHRVQVEVFSINYVFYTSAGIKVKMQKRKKFVFVKYWVSDDCDDIAIGFNMVTGTLKFNNPANYSSIAPTASSRWNSFKSTINNIENDFVYQRVFNSEVVQDWINPCIDKLYMILPNIKIKNIIGKGNMLDWPTHDVLQQMYDAPYKYACSRLEGINGQIYNKIEGRIKPTDPRIAYVVWGQDEQTFNKAKPFISGSSGIWSDKMI